MILKQFNRVYTKSMLFENSIYGGLIFGGSYTRGVLYSEVYGMSIQSGYGEFENDVNYFLISLICPN